MFPPAAVLPPPQRRAVSHTTMRGRPARYSQVRPDARRYGPAAQSPQRPPGPARAPRPARAAAPSRARTAPRLGTDQNKTRGGGGPSAGRRPQGEARRGRGGAGRLRADSCRARGPGRSALRRGGERGCGGAARGPPRRRDVRADARARPALPLCCPRGGSPCSAAARSDRRSPQPPRCAALRSARTAAAAARGEGRGRRAGPRGGGAAPRRGPGPAEAPSGSAAEPAGGPDAAPALAVLLTVIWRLPRPGLHAPPPPPRRSVLSRRRCWLSSGIRFLRRRAPPALSFPVGSPARLSLPPLRIHPLRRPRRLPTQTAAPGPWISSPVPRFPSALLRAASAHPRPPPPFPPSLFPPGSLSAACSPPSPSLPSAFPYLAPTLSQGL